MTDERIRPGDYVLHRPTGEEWWILGVNYAQGKLCAAGWPPTIANIADCELTERGNELTDSERESRQRSFGGEWDD